MKYIWNGNQNGANLSSCPSSSISSPNLQHRNLKFSDNSEINSWNKKSTCSKLEAPSSSLSFSACAPPSIRVWQSFKKSISFPYHILLLSFCSIFLNKVKLKYFIPQLRPRKYLPIFTRLSLSLLACPRFFKESFHTSTKKVSPTFSQTFQPWSSATPQHEKEGCKEVCLNQMNLRMIWISPGGQEKASQGPQPTLRNGYQHQSAPVSINQHQ